MVLTSIAFGLHGWMALAVSHPLEPKESIRRAREKAELVRLAIVSRIPASTSHPTPLVRLLRRSRIPQGRSHAHPESYLPYLRLPDLLRMVPGSGGSFVRALP